MELGSGEACLSDIPKPFNSSLNTAFILQSARKRRDCPIVPSFCPCLRNPARSADPDKSPRGLSSLSAIVFHSYAVRIYVLLGSKDKRARLPAILEFPIIDVRHSHPSVPSRGSPGAHTGATTSSLAVTRLE
ncbi:hypothetical protein KC354_g50 [Hortaea werneckii]|nr:hypothetical protein KC354_g50 [Hortaea werneckii]